MNCEIFFQKLKVEVDDQKMPMHKLFIAGFVSSLCVGVLNRFLPMIQICSKMKNARLLFTKTDPVEKI
jgi:hypothetical protein